MKTVIYARVSTKEQHEKNQLPECKAYAEKLGLTEYDIIQEKVSAFKNPDRKSLAKLMNYDHVIVWSYDRLHRNRKRFVELIKYFQSQGKKIHCVRESWIEKIHEAPSPWNEIIGNLAIEIVGFMAEEESRKRSDRVKIAYQNRKNEWGRKKKEIDIDHLEECFIPGSLRKTAEKYNDGLHKNRKISYVTVKKITEEFPERFSVKK